MNIINREAGRSARGTMRSLPSKIITMTQPSTHPISGIIDAHVHVWTEDQAGFPHDRSYRGAAYQPADFPPSELLSLARPCGVDRVVLVQMSFYGTDNSYLLDAIRRYPSVFSGIAVIDSTSASLEDEVAYLAAHGVRGFRVDWINRPPGWTDSTNLRRLWRLAGERGLAICPLIAPESLPELDSMCAQFPQTAVVVDHMARIGLHSAVRKEDVESLCRLARHENTNVKISAFYALGKKQPPYTDLVPVIQALSDAYGPERLMWGSDSPFQMKEPHSYAASIALVRDQLDFLKPRGLEWLLRKSAEKLFF